MKGKEGDFLIIGILIGGLLALFLCISGVEYQKDIVHKDFLDEFCVELYGNGWYYYEPWGDFAVEEFICEYDETRSNEKPRRSIAI